METNALQTLAVSKAVKEDAYKTASKATEVGKYDVDVTVRIVGTITKAENETQFKPDTKAIEAAIRLAIGSAKYDAIVASVPPMVTVASGKVTSKLTVEVV